MKERPILFSGDMVRALLAGRKTQTRRAVKPQPETEPEFSRAEANAPIDTHVWTDGSRCFRCPYGLPGDRLWVRETFALEAPAAVAKTVFYLADGDRLPAFARAWVPSIFMRRWMSRIALEITSVRVERVQSITAADARAEGIKLPVVEHDTLRGKGTPLLRISGKHLPASYCAKPVAEWTEADWWVTHYAALWDSINGKKAPWSANPWVWVIEFRKVSEE